MWNTHDLVHIDVSALFSALKWPRSHLAQWEHASLERQEGLGLGRRRNQSCDQRGDSRLSLGEPLLGFETSRKRPYGRFLH